MPILIGDFNAMTGEDNTGYEDIMETNELEHNYGKRFTDLCTLH